MTDKTRMTFTVTEEQARYLKNKDNQSAHVRRLIKADMQGHDIDTAGLKLQIQTLEQQAQQAAEKEEMYQNRAEELSELVEQAEGRQQAELAEARQVLEHATWEVTNDAIQEWAKDVGMSPQQLCEELEDAS